MKQLDPDIMFETKTPGDQLEADWTPLWRWAVVESNGEDVQWPWFSGICLDGEVAGQYEMDLAFSPQEPEDTGVAGVLALDGLAPITIFVGANNSGKSRLMRELFKTQQPSRFKLKSRDTMCCEVDIGSKITSWIETIGGQFDDSLMNGWITVDGRIDINSNLSTLDSQIARAQNQGNTIKIEELNMLKQSLYQYGINQEVSGLHQVNRCYVPMIRGMRPPLTLEQAGQIQIDDKDWYKLRTKRDHFANVGDLQMRNRYGEQQIFTGLGLYTNLRERLLARTQTIRDSVRDYESFLSKHFFPGQVVTLIPVEEGDNDVVHIKIGNIKEYPIYDLGDGMQSLIICTYPIVTETKPGSLFFLEEPDLCMHPSLQRTFLEVLKTYHRKMGHQFFITTHSNHLLDLLEDNELVSIFSFSEIADRAPAPTDSSQVDSGSNPQQSKPKPSFRIRPSDLDDRKTLLELGVRPSATYLANATIWVEGVSDCAYLRAYMEAFVHYLKIRGSDWGTKLAQRLQQYKEDRHYAFVEYSGANLTHYSFQKGTRINGQAEVGPNIVSSVSNLCARAIVIADGDIAGINKADRWKRYAKQLENFFIVLPCKEIENLIPEFLVRRQVSRDYPEIDEADLAKIKYGGCRKPGKGLGDYLSKFNFFKVNYAANSGTLKRHRKDGWASNQKGIPWLLRQEIESEQQELNRKKEGEKNEGVIGVPENAGHPHANDEPQGIKELPNYLTQDIVWLCLCIYAHIAECNHDCESEKKLKDFLQFIKHQGAEPQRPPVDPNGESQPCAESESPAESAAPEWPIKDVNRNCLLATYQLALTNS